MTSQENESQAEYAAPAPVEERAHCKNLKSKGECHARSTNSCPYQHVASKRGIDKRSSSRTTKGGRSRASSKESQKGSEKDSRKGSQKGSENGSRKGYRKGSEKGSRTKVHPSKTDQAPIVLDLSRRRDLTKEQIRKFRGPSMDGRNSEANICFVQLTPSGCQKRDCQYHHPTMCRTKDCRNREYEKLHARLARIVAPVKTDDESPDH